jgi:hypothetical protein
VSLLLAYDIKNGFSHVVRKYILGANLNDAWTFGLGESQRGDAQAVEIVDYH